MDLREKSLIAPIPWEEKERRILADVQRRASFLMWAGFLVYGSTVALAGFLYGDSPKTALVIMCVQFLMVIWMGTRAMFANMSSVLRLSLEANRSMMPAFEKAAQFADQVGNGTHPAIQKLTEAAESLKKIQESIERSTKPSIPVTRRGEKAAV